ncbi:MAG: hypothetical protein PUC29_05865, partial [Clostridia bacterium]|nr:hypothetical protein [Clostridia bacterium]
MKKILAIVLTLAMLLSMVAVGTSAATREVTQDESTENHYWHFQSGNSWHPVKFSDPSQTVEMDICLDDATSNLGCYGLSNAPSIGASYVGLKDNSQKVDYTFTPGTWYNVKWVSANGSTEIFVNGASVGTVGAELSYYDGNQFYWAPVLLSMDNVKVGGQTFDFEGDNSAWNTESGQGELLIQEIPGAFHNNLTWSWQEQGTRYWAYDADNAYIYATNIPVGPDSGYTTITFKVRFNDASSETRSYFGTDIVISPSKIGFGGNTVAISPALSLNEWHEISINCYNMNGASFYKIDGGECSIANYDGLIQGVLKNSWCGGGILVDFDDIVIKSSADGATYETIYTEDFEDGVWDISEGNGVAKYDMVNKSASDDLGFKYWHFQSGNSWHPVKFNNPAQTVEMDVCLDDATSNLGCYGLSNAPAIGASYVGLKDNSQSVAYTFTPGTWYNVKWVSNGSTTEIFVDGVSVGTVNAGITYHDNNQFYWAPVLLSMDNVKVGGQTFDFEGDYSAWNTESGQGELLEYVLKSETIFDRIPAYEATGEALALSSSYDTPGFYYDISSMAGSGKDVIVDFNLKLLPQTNERIADQQTSHWLEFWLDQACQNRVCIATDAVGVQRKASNDWNAFAFGADTWHRVTVEALGSYNIINIYIDTELVYTGTCGEVHWLNGNLLIGFVYNATALINNYHVYASKTYAEASTSFSDVDNNANEVVVDLNNICARYHFAGNTAITTPETCYSTGIDTTTCAVCGTEIEHETPMYDHNWASYDINRKTEDGLVYTYCRNSNGCTARRYTTLPENYTGTIYQYFDMSDDLVLNCNSGWNADNWTAKDGKLSFVEGSNYNQFDLNQEIAPNNWSWSMDITFDGLFDDKDVANYGHVVYFWCGGSNTIAVQAGYDFDAQEFFIRPNDGGSFTAQKAAYKLELGRQYNFGITYEYDEDEYTGAVKLWLDGKVVCQYTDAEDEEIVFVIPYSSSTIHALIWRDFGVNHTIDAMGIGTADFTTVSKIIGDVDGDWTTGASDVVAFRRFFSAQADAKNLAENINAD